MELFTKKKKFKIGDSYKLSGIFHKVLNVENKKGGMQKLTLSKAGVDEESALNDAVAEHALANIIVEYNGMKFSANDVDQGRMNRTIVAMKNHNLGKQMWALHEEFNDEDTTLLTVDDLQNIMELGLQEIGKALL